MTIQEIQDNYAFLEPMPGYIVVKEVIEEGGGGLIKSGQTESKAYGIIIAVPGSLPSEKDSCYVLGGAYLKTGDLVCYNEYEGQELFKYGKITEDHLIVLKVTDVLLKIN